MHFQVEDVFRKFDVLKEAEARSWVEENKPAPRRRKLVKVNRKCLTSQRFLVSMLLGMG